MHIKCPDWLFGYIIRRALKTPYTHLNGYMNRWWLVVPPGHEAGSDERADGLSGIGVRLHEILRSDDERAMHDHPWWSISWILRGGYIEHSLRGDGKVKVQWRGAGSLIFRRSTAIHRLQLHENEPVVTLFIMGPWRRDWGFWLTNPRKWSRREQRWVGGFWSYWRIFLNKGSGVS